MKKIYIHVVSCRRRSLDAKKISDYLLKNDYSIVNKPEDADTIIFITCAFIDNITEDSLNKVKEFQKYNAELIVAGCLPAIEPERLSKIFDGKTVCTESIDDIYRYFPETKIKSNDMDDANVLYENKKSLIKKRESLALYRNLKDYFLKIIFGKKSFYYRILLKKPFLVRISWGCHGNCSYCAIKKAIGPHKSKPLDQCINEIKKGLNKGHKQFLLTADDAGAYGLDSDSSFSELVDKIVNLDGEFTIGIESLNPVWLVKYFDELKVNLKNKNLEYIDCAIQSGSEKILKLMNRYSNTKKITDVILNVKKLNPHLLLTTEIIIGFPGETKEDFHKTLALLKKLQFNGGFIYRFARKADTKAEKIEPKISEKEIINRIKYARKFLKKEGYKFYYLKSKDYYIFDKK